MPCKLLGQFSNLEKIKFYSYVISLVLKDFPYSSSWLCWHQISFYFSAHDFDAGHQRAYFHSNMPSGPTTLCSVSVNGHREGKGDLQAPPTRGSQKWPAPHHIHQWWCLQWDFHSADPQNACDHLLVNMREVRWQGKQSGLKSCSKCTSFANFIWKPVQLCDLSNHLIYLLFFALCWLRIK